MLELESSSDRFSFRQLRHAFEDVLAINLKVIEQMILSSFFKISQGTTFVSGQKLNLKIINADIECLFFDHKLVVTSVPSRFPWHFLSAMCVSSPYTIELSETNQVPWGKSLYSLLFHFLQFREVQHSQCLLNTVFLSPFSKEFADQSKPYVGELSSLYNAIFSSSEQGLRLSLPKFITRYQEALREGMVSYPTLFQLKAEKAFVKYPILRGSAACYALSLLLFLFHSLRNFRKKMGKAGALLLSSAAWALMTVGFLLQGGALLFKTVVFSYPPLSTMFDSVLFVSWLSVLIGFVFFVIFRTRFPIFGALICTEALFLFLFALNVRDPFAPVDPVLNSSFWLTVHVAVVASSYGVLLLGGILGHLSLTRLFQGKREASPLLSRCIVHCIYLGSFFLVIGTLLGALWADSSWGRFWDWDAKESCALITICYYLALIHLNHFKWAGTFATALGSSFGMILLSFTWYGVNFLLGTGLHAYGKGIGGELFYLAYIVIELLFFAAVLIHRKRLMASSKKIRRSHSAS